MWAKKCIMKMLNNKLNNCIHVLRFDIDKHVEIYANF